MNVFDLFAKLSIDTSEYEQGLDDAESKGESFGDKLSKGLGTAGKVAGASIAALGTASVALGKSFVDGMGNVADYGDNIDKMSQKMGFSAEAFQEWDFIMQHNGSSIEAVKGAIMKMDKALESDTDAWDKLGLSQEQLLNMSSEDKFEATIAALQGVTDETEKAALAQDIFGKSYMEMMPLLNSSAEDTEAMKNQVHELGGVMSDEAVKASAQYTDSLQNMQTAMTGLKNNMLSEFLPAASQVMDGLSKIFSGDMSGLEDIDIGVDTLITNLTDALPQIMEVGGRILESLGDALIKNLPKIASTASKIILKLGTYLIENLPAIVKAGLQIITELASSIAAALPELIPTIVEVITSIVETLIDNIDLLIDGAIQLILGLAEGLIKALPVLIEKLPVLITKVIDAVIENLPILIDGLIQLINMIVENLPTIIIALVEALPTIIEAVVNGLIEALPQLIEGAIQLVVALVEHLPEIIMALIEAIPEIITSILEAFGPIVEGLGQVFTQAWEGIKEVFSKVGDFFSEKFEAAKEKVGEAFSGAKEKLSETWENIKDVFSSVGTWFKDKFNDAKEKASEAWGKIKEKMTQSWDNIKNVFGSVGSWFSEKFTDAKDKVVNAWSNIKQKMSEVWQKIKDGFSIKDALTWGKDMIQNFIDGITEKIGALKEKLGSVAQTVKDFLGFSEPKFGPLHDFHTFAPDMMELFAQGIADNADIVTDQIAKSFDFGDMIVKSGAASVDTASTQPVVIENHIYLEGDADRLFRVIQTKANQNYIVTGNRELVTI